MNKNAFWNISYGIYIVSSLDGIRPIGCIANSIMQITSDPATFAISINHDNFTNKCIVNTGKFGISILAENILPSVIGTFGYKSGKAINKFDSVPYALKEGMPIINDCCAYIVCDVINTMETETHAVFLGKVVDADVVSDGVPMTYSYYHKVIKGASPKNAPTYIGEDRKNTQKSAFEKQKIK